MKGTIVITIKNISSEKEFRNFLNTKGFVTNNSKHDNANGVDIVAIKNGVSYLIEVKKIEKRKNGAYRHSGNIKGDVFVGITPKGNAVFIVEGSISLTKTARFIDSLDEIC